LENRQGKWGNPIAVWVGTGWIWVSRGALLRARAEFEILRDDRTKRVTGRPVYSLLLGLRCNENLRNPPPPPGFATDPAKGKAFSLARSA
jgi:hypothetical protein